MKRRLWILLFLSVARNANAHPYITVHDDGTIANFSTHDGSSPVQLLADMMAMYDSTGAPRPEILSVWTTFNFDGNSVETIPLAAELLVSGIGLEDQYPTSTFTTTYPPTRIALMHNNVMRLDDRAKASHAPADHFADYLFLLELSHYWGPSARIPAPSPTELIGFTFHWTFWMDAGGSPAGGNRWHDNGDGTFSTIPQTPGGVTYSMLDLYMMGLADPAEVPPFGVLENPVPVANQTGGPYVASSFPRFESTPYAVTATRRALTIDDIITANGPRMPARNGAPSSFTLGIVLLVPQDASADDVSAAQQVFDPIAGRLASDFSTATMGRGALNTITSEADPTDAGVEAPSDAAVPATMSKGGCTFTPNGAPTLTPWMLLLALGLFRRHQSGPRDASVEVAPA